MDVADGFEEFVESRSAALLRAAYLLTGDRGHSEDLVQAALVRVYVRWGRLRSTDAAFVYTSRVMARLAIRWGKRRWRHEIPTEAVERAVEGDEFERVDVADAVERALAGLPVEQRVVLVLRYWEQHSEAEIASIVRCSRGTVKSRAARGLTALRDVGVLDTVEEVRESSERGT